MKRKLLALVLPALMVVTLCFSPAAAEDKSAGWVKAMEIHAGLKGLSPLAGCEFKLDAYTPADGTFSAQADIPEKELRDFIEGLWQASQSVSTAAFSRATWDEGRGRKEVEDIAQLDLSHLWQIRWTYYYDAGPQSKIQGSAKHMVITIDDKRTVSFMVMPDRN